MRRMPLGTHCKARLVASSRNPFNYAYRHAGLTLPGSGDWQLSMREMKTLGVLTAATCARGHMIGWFSIFGQSDPANGRNRTEFLERCVQRRRCSLLTSLTGGLPLCRDGGRSPAIPWSGEQSHLINNSP